MTILLILAHPTPGSFNHALAETVAATLRANGHQILCHDLCAERFDPLLPGDEIPQHGVVPNSIQTHCREVADADGIIVVHPNWWGMPPAILTGWVDRVIRPGVAYRFDEDDNGEGVPIGLLKARTALVLNTANTPDGREQAVFGDPLESIWKRCIFDLCGVRDFHRRVFGVVVTSTSQDRQQWLAEASDLATRLFS